jgi:hypothetical protein
VRETIKLKRRTYGEGASKGGVMLRPRAVRRSKVVSGYPRCYCCDWAQSGPTRRMLRRIVRRREERAWVRAWRTEA